LSDVFGVRGKVRVRVTAVRGFCLVGDVCLQCCDAIIVGIGERVETKRDMVLNPIQQMLMSTSASLAIWGEMYPRTTTIHVLLYK
jgi:hypothetical protein